MPFVASISKSISSISVFFTILFILLSPLKVFPFKIAISSSLLILILSTLPSTLAEFFSFIYGLNSRLSLS